MYESFYGLKTKPFSLLPDPGFLYLGKQHRVALALLEYALVNNAGFCVITGEIGAGKTTLLRKLLDTIDDDVTVGMISNTHSSFGELLDWVLSAFGIHEPDLSKVEMHQRLVDFLLEQYAGNRSTLLIVDEAQNMPAATLEELRMLSNVNSEKDLVFQVILSGQPGLRDTLRQPELLQFVQRISVDYHLDALSSDETCAYIQHRLVTAGAEQDIFSPEACRLIHDYSGGVPRLINLLSDTALVYAFADQKNLVNADIVEEMVKERMENSIMPLVRVDRDKSSAKSDNSNFPWISPDGGSQGLKPAAEKKTTEKTAEKADASVEDTQSGTEKPVESTPPVETTPELTAAAPPREADADEMDSAVENVTAEETVAERIEEDSADKPGSGEIPVLDAVEKISTRRRQQPAMAADESEPEQVPDEPVVVVDQVDAASDAETPRKSRVKTWTVASLLVVAVAGLAFAMIGTLTYENELKKEVNSKLVEVEKMKRDLERMQNEAKILQRERDAALVSERQKDAQSAIEAAEREREAMAAAALAAEKALQATREAEELARQQRLKEKRLSEERKRLQMEKQRAELEQQRLQQERRQAELEKQRLELEQAEREKRAQQEREERIAREQDELFKAMEEADAAKLNKTTKPSAGKKESSFSTDPCSSPSAKFLSTCR
jgi:type II secretory pathway predicted ATPase ExeA